MDKLPFFNKIVRNVLIVKDMNNNKNRTYTFVEKTAIVKKTSQTDKVVINNIFASVIQKIKDKHLS